MAKMIINGEVCSGSNSYASAITYIKEDGTKSTVQKELDSRPVNNNLLINSNFANPVNQRGVTAETWISNRYGIDRWITDMTFSSITNGLTIGSLGATSFLSQRFEEGTIVNGKKYSFSICIDGVIYNGTNTTDNSKGMVFVNNDIIKAYIDYSTDNDYWYLGLEFKTVGVTIEWAKLELGEVATPYVPRLYAEELHLCQRYYQIHSLRDSYLYALNNNSIYFYKKFPVNVMRVAPSVSFSASCVVQSNANSKSGFTFELNGSYFDSVSYIATKTSHGLNYASYITCIGLIYLDAEL